MRYLKYPICSMLIAAFIFLTGMAAIALHPDLAYGATHYRYTTGHTRRSIIHEADAAGYGEVQTHALLRLAYRESSYRSWVTNGECHGVFQLSRGMAHGHKWWGPKWNTRRAIRYIRGRYGKPTRALAHSYSRGYY